MFTGIISAIGDITNLEERAGDARLTIRTGNKALTGQFDHRETGTVAGNAVAKLYISQA